MDEVVKVAVMEADVVEVLAAAAIKLSAKEKQQKALRAPPKAGEPYEKTIGGKTLLWCGQCGMWGENTKLKIILVQKG